MIKPLYLNPGFGAFRAGVIAGPFTEGSFDFLSDLQALFLPSGTMCNQIAIAVHCRPGDEIVTVSEESLSRALLMLLERSKQVVEPAGAVGVAALLAGAVEVTTPAVVVLSGGNIDPLLMLRVIEPSDPAPWASITEEILDVTSGYEALIPYAAQ